MTHPLNFPQAPDSQKSFEAEDFLINSDESHAHSILLTDLGNELFPILQKIYGISRFVRTTFQAYPRLCSAAWHWQQAYQQDDSPENWKICFESFCFQLFAQDPGGLNEAQIMRAARVFRRSHAAALAFAELADLIDIKTSCRMISCLAESLIKSCYQWAYQSVVPRFGTPGGRSFDEPCGQNMLVLAMGKLGGFELNFSSDIDLIFFYPHAGETQGTSRSVDNARFFQRVSTQLIKLLDEVTADGFVYRVDMRLRPYGDSGALVMSFAQAEDYYQEQGREWERFAMLRARPVTGSSKEQQALMAIIRPFSFRRYIDYGVLDSIRGMKEMIQRDVRRKGMQGNIKLGPGGIREIEFIVQSMQLIHGGRDKRLRERNTLKVLPLLVEAKLLESTIAKDLDDSYRFLRRVEHCLQELEEKQTQQLPGDPQNQGYLCLAMHYADWPQLLEAIESVQHQVSQHFSGLFAEPQNHRFDQNDFFLSLAEGHIDTSELIAHLSRMEPVCRLEESEAQLFIETLSKFNQDARVSNLSARGARRLKMFFPTLLSTCLSTSEPAICLSRLLDVLLSIIRRTAYLELLSENPPMLQHLVDLVGRSPWVAQRLAEYPVLLDELLYPSTLYEPLQGNDLRAELQQTLLRVDPQNEEEMMDSLRRFKQTNELRVAASLLTEKASISQVSRYLTQLAELVLEACVHQCWHLLTAKHGQPKLNHDNEEGSSGFAVVGYGKLGGLELGFGSDLDLVFLFDQAVDGQTDGERSIGNSRFYTRLAQKIIHFLSTRTNQGILYQVDMRLRPSGSSGLLVSHIDAYRDYQMESAWTWEHQALVRARVVLGHEAIRRQFELIRQQALTKPRELLKLQQEVVAMRGKMREQLEIKMAGKVDLKQTCGGLVDIEFLAQYFCLSGLLKLQPGESPPTNTAQAIKLAASCGLLDEKKALQLVRNYRLFRNQLNEMALLSADSLVDGELFADQILQVSQCWLEQFSPVLSFSNETPKEREHP